MSRSTMIATAFGVVIGAVAVAAAVTVGFGVLDRDSDGADGADDAAVMIVFMEADASDAQLARIEEVLNEQPQFLESPVYCDAPCSMAEAEVLLAGEPGVLELLNETNIPTSWRSVVVDDVDQPLVAALADALREGPGVVEVQVGPLSERSTSLFD